MDPSQKDALKMYLETVKNMSELMGWYKAKGNTTWIKCERKADEAIKQIENLYALQKPS